jgi:hypothetical protein
MLVRDTCVCVGVCVCARVAEEMRDSVSERHLCLCAAAGAGIQDIWKQAQMMDPKKREAVSPVMLPPPRSCCPHSLMQSRCMTTLMTVLSVVRQRACYLHCTAQRLLVFTTSTCIYRIVQLYSWHRNKEHVELIAHVWHTCNVPVDVGYTFRRCVRTRRGVHMLTQTIAGRAQEGEEAGRQDQQAGGQDNKAMNNTSSLAVT